MRIGAQETISDALLCSIGPGGPEWLQHEVIAKLAQHLAREIVTRYRGNITREGSFASGTTNYRLQLMVFSDDELKDFINDQVEKRNERNKA